MTNELSMLRTTKIVWYVFYILEVLLFFRFFLKLLGANPAAGFTDLIYTLSSFPVAPFQFVFGTNSIQGSIFEWSTLLAILVYWVIAMGIVKLVLVGRPLNQFEAKRELDQEDDNV